jgi:anti-sigma factor RsiW
MDCKRFRKNHLGYLDDTLPGTDMAAAQRHLLACERCAAHDALVRRSLMAARSLPTLEPSADFQAKLRARLAQCRAEQQAEALNHHSVGLTDTMLPLLAPTARVVHPVRTAMVVAAGAVLGVVAWQSVRDSAVPELRMAPVIASTPAMPESPYVSPELLKAMATGNPVWSAAMVVDDLPVTFVSTNYTFDAGR